MSEVELLKVTVVAPRPPKSTVAPVNCADVAIDLSTDGGNTFPTSLTAATPNDGSEMVTIPDTQTTLARVRVSCVGNVFFDISNTNFTIAAALPAPTVTSIDPTSGPFSGGTSVTVTGTGFVNGAVVLFGGLGATSVTFNSSTSLTAVTPAQGSGTVSVTVFNPDGQSATLSSAFLYFNHTAELIFADGFESGDTGEWSSTQP